MKDSNSKLNDYTSEKLFTLTKFQKIKKDNKFLEILEFNSKKKVFFEPCQNEKINFSVNQNSNNINNNFSYENNFGTNSKKKSDLIFSDNMGYKSMYKLTLKNNFLEEKNNKISKIIKGNINDNTQNKNNLNSNKKDEKTNENNKKCLFDFFFKKKENNKKKKNFWSCFY